MSASRSPDRASGAGSMRKGFYPPGPGRVWFIILICIVFTRCSDRNEVRVIGKNFGEEVGNLQNLVFSFNRNLWPEHLLGVWDSTRFVSFEPKLEGKFKWTAPNELVFSPAGPLKAATDYQASITGHVLKHAEQAHGLKVSKDVIAFHTPFLTLKRTRSWWALSSLSGRPESRVQVFFNYPVDEATVRERLRVLRGETVLEHRFLPSQSSESVLLALPGNPEPGEDLTIELGKGIKIESESFTTKEAVSQKFRLASPLELKVENVSSGFSNNRGYLEVETTQELVPENISSSLELQPQIPFTVEPQESGFIVRADFSETETYVLKVGKTLKGVLGQTLQEEVTQDFFFGKMPESIRFASKKGLYLSTKGNRNIGVQITNVPSVQVKISKVYDNNLLYYLYNRRYENYSEINGNWGPDGSYNYSEDYGNQYSDVLVDRKVSTEDLPVLGGVRALNLAVPEVHGKARKGVYLVSVASTDAMYLSAQKLVSVSDIGLIVKQGLDDVWVFANSIYDATPVKNAEITLISANNQEMHTMVTDANGVAHVSGMKEKAPGFKLAMVTASKDDDFNYLAVNDSQVETSRFEVEGVRSNSTGMQAFIYGERDIYRPGETLHFVSVLRSENWKPVAELPVKLKLVTPNGQLYGSWLKTTNKEGATEVSVKVEEASLTGAYTMELYNANDVLLASSVVNVEEFVPDRIKVDLDGGKAGYLSGETVSLNAVATNLFGPPASGRTYEMELQLRRKQFRAKDFPEFEFEIPAEVSFERVKKQGATDAEGKAKGDFILSEAYKDIGMLDGKVYVTVFDENGRAVNRVHSFEVATQPVLFGVRLPDRYVGVNVPVQTEILSVDPSGRIRPGESAGIEVMRVSYQTVIEKRDGQMQYRSKRKEETVYAQTLKLGSGRGSFRYTPTVSGEYEIRIRRPGAEHYTSVTYYAYGFGFTEYSSFEVSNEGRVLIETDKKKYSPGEKARILFKAPFDGKLLVTAEQGEVLYHQVIDTKEKAAELVLPVSQGYLPNVYITATLIRPSGADQIPLTVAHGFEPLMVESAERVMKVKITASEVSRSKTRQRIRVKADPHAQLTLGIVDEGILQIRNFTTPDIYGHFYRKRALEVQASDLYAALFPELGFAQGSSAGGDGYNLERRINPLGNGNRNLVRFWSGLLQADAKGEAVFDIDIPQFSGALRVMAVAFKDQAFGSASQQVRVSDPLVISAGVPRFMAPGDQLVMPVTFTNSEKRSADGSVSVTVKGPLESDSFSNQPLGIAAGREQRMLIRLKASGKPGNGKVLITARAFGENFTQEYDLNVRPASPLLKVAGSGTVKGGETKQVNLAQGFMPETSAAQLLLSASPLVQEGGKALSTLLGYPHGCLEQSVSKAFPQLYFGDLVKGMGVPVYMVGRGESDLNPAFNVQQAIRKVESSQLFNGGFTMWPGGVKDDWWVSAYALQFLDEARRAGFEVNPAVLQAAVTYLTNKSGRAGTEDVPVQKGDGGRIVKKQAPAEASYSLYVLAATGNANRAMMNYYKQHQELLTNEARYLLAGAYYYVGDSRSYRELLPKSYKSEDYFQDQAYITPLSSLGLVLNMLVDTDPQNMQIPVLARQLSQAVASAGTLNTQEAVFAVLGLGKIARSAGSSTATAEVFSGSKSLGTFSGKKEVKLTAGLLDGPLNIRAQGDGRIYWFSETSGFDASGRYTEEDDGLRVRRQYLDRSGKAVSEFRQNDLIVVRITLASTRRIDVPNVVVTDLLPAGFEVENPRLTSSRDLAWIKNAAVPDYFDIRDDRIHYFVTATPAEKVFYYQARITSAGTFVTGPVAADAMYQTNLKSYSGGGKITVK